MIHGVWKKALPCTVPLQTQNERLHWSPEMRKHLSIRSQVFTIYMEIIGVSLLRNFVTAECQSCLRSIIKKRHLQTWRNPVVQTARSIRTSAAVNEPLCSQCHSELWRLHAQWPALLGEAFSSSLKASRGFVAETEGEKWWWLRLGWNVQIK